MAPLLLPSRTCALLLLHTPCENPCLWKSQPFLHPKHASKSLSSSFALLCTSLTTPLSHSSPSNLLPFLHDEEGEKQPRLEQEAANDEVIEEEELNLTDPILRFSKSQASTTQNRPVRGRLPLNKEHLAPNFQPDTQNTTPSPTLPTNPTLRDPTPPADGVVGEIIQIARDLPEDTTLGEQLGGYEGRVREKECLQVLRLFGEHGMWMACFYFYEWMLLQEPSLVTPRACTVLFPILGKAGMGDQLMALIRNLPDKEEFRIAPVYDAVIYGLLTCGRYPDAYEVYDMMERNNVLPDHFTCTIMIAVMRKSGRSAKEVWEFFERMNRKGINWTPEVLGALVKAFCDEGLKNEALVIQTEMARKGIFPDVFVYNTLMDAYGKSNQVEEVEGLFAEMKSRGIKPTSATYNILMDAYSRRMQPEVVEELLVEMQDAGLEPDEKSYTCLISAYGRQKKMSEMAADAFLRMQKVGIKPTSHSYTALIHAYAISGWHEEANATFENMRNDGIEPSIETYTTMLDSSRRAGDTETLMNIWKLMMKEKVEGTRVTFNTLLDGLAKQGQYNEARDVIYEFGKLGFQPTVVTYNMLMNAYARGGRHSELPQLLKEMAVRELKPDSVTYMTTIYAYVRVRDFRRAFFYHKMMVKSGQVPDKEPYQKLRSVLDVKAAIKNRKDRSAILGIAKSQMGLSKVKRKGKKDEFWKNKKSLRVHNFAHDGE